MRIQSDLFVELMRLTQSSTLHFRGPTGLPEAKIERSEISLTLISVCLRWLILKESLM